MMLDKNYADFAWDQTAALLAVDSPSGFTARAAQWVQGAFEALGCPAVITRKGGVLAELGERMPMMPCCWRPTPIPWAPWSARSRAMAA